MKSYRFLWLLILSGIAFSSLQAQTVVPCDQRLMRNINFAYTGGGAAPDCWETTQTGSRADGFQLSDGFPFATDCTMAVQGKEYAIVSNPSSLNTNFASVTSTSGGAILVLTPDAGSAEEIAQFVVNGLVAGNTYTMEIKAWNLNKVASPNDCCWEDLFTMEVFTNNPGDNHPGGQWAVTSTNGQSGTMDMWGNQGGNHALRPSANGTLATFRGNITLRTTTNTPETQITIRFKAKNTITLGIESIKIFGCETTAISVSGGTTKVCENDPVTLTAQGITPAGGTITWHEGSLTGPVQQSSTSKSLDVIAGAAKTTQTYYAVGEWDNVSVTLQPRVCCSSASGGQAEVFRESFDNVIWTNYNGFNRANISNLYPAAGANTAIGAAYCFNPGNLTTCTTCKNAAGGNCEDPRNINDGEYAVVRSSRDGGWWSMGWSVGQLNEHTGTTGSGALLINATSSQDFFYRRELTGLCANTMYEFSAYFASINTPDELQPIIQFEVYAGGTLGGGGTLIEQTDPIYVTRTPAGTMPTWENASITFSTAGLADNTKFYVQIKNSQTAGGGNDIMIDDIVVNKCIANIYIEGGGERESLTTCSTSGVDLKINAAQSVLNVVAEGSPTGNVYYQWRESTSPTGPWTDIAGIPIQILLPTAQATIHTPAATVGTVKYYQAKIASTQARAENWTLNLLDGCGNDAMSNIFKIEIQSGSYIQDFTPASRCGTGTVQLSAITNPAGGTVEWFDADGNSLGTSLSGADWPTPSISVTTTFYAEVQGSPCTGGSRTAVVATVNPVANITSPSIAAQTVCQNVAFDPISVTITDVGVGALAYQWYRNTTAANTGGTAVSGATNASFTPPSSTVGTTYYYCVVTKGGLCPVTSEVSGAMTVDAPATITPNAGGKDRSICVNTALATNIVFNTTGATGATVTGLPAGMNGAFTGNATAGTVTISGTPTSSAGSPFTYTIALIDGCGITTTGIITVNDIPAAPTVTSPVKICLGGTPQRLTATGTALKWYDDNVTTTALPEAPTPSTAAVADISYFVSQTVNACESPRAEIVVNITNNPYPATVDSYTKCAETGTAIPWASLVKTAGTNAWFEDAAATIPASPTDFDPNVARPTPALPNYWVVVTESNGCKTSPTEVNVTIHELPASVVNLVQDVICPGGNDGAIDWISNLGTAPFSYSWKNASGAVVASTASVSGLSAGTYTLTITDGNSCTATSTAVTVAQGVDKQAPQIGITIPRTEAPNGNNCIFTIPDFRNTIRSNSTDNCTTDQADLVVTQNPAPATEITADTQVTVTVADAAGNVATTTIDVYLPAMPVLTFEPVSALCGNDAPVALTAYNDMSFQGTLRGDGVIGTMFYPSLANVGPNTIMYTVNPYGCVRTATQEVTVHPVPVIKLDAPNVCPEADLIATATSGYARYDWTVNGTPDPQTGSTYTYNGTKQPGDQFSFDVVAVSDMNCVSDMATATASVYTVPTITVLPPEIYCATPPDQGKRIQWRDLVYTDENQVRWFATEDSSTPIISPESIDQSVAGTYTMYAAAINDGGCLSSAVPVPVTAVVNPNPVLSSIDTSDLENIRVTVSGGEKPYIYNMNGYSGHTDGEINFGFLPIGRYELTVIDSKGCIMTDFIPVLKYKLLPDEFFTPNGDNKNEIWRIKYLGYYQDDDVKISVFDRNGKELLRKNARDCYITLDNYGEIWDGSFNGKMLPSDDYWYVISIGKLGERMTGHFSLKR